MARLKSCEHQKIITERISAGDHVPWSYLDLCDYRTPPILGKKDKTTGSDIERIKDLNGNIVSVINFSSDYITD